MCVNGIRTKGRNARTLTTCPPPRPPNTKHCDAADVEGRKGAGEGGFRDGEVVSLCLQTQTSTHRILGEPLHSSFPLPASPSHSEADLPSVHWLSGVIILIQRHIDFVVQCRGVTGECKEYCLVLHEKSTRKIRFLSILVSVVG